MKKPNLRRFIMLAGALGLFTVSARALAGDADEHSWKWPLYKRVDNSDGSVALGKPRPAIWNMNGEFQSYGGAPYLHNGVDIRGQKGDPAVVPIDSTIVAVFLYNSDCTNGGTNTGHCRVWFETPNKRFFYYFGHLDFSTALTTDNRPISNDMRDKIQTVVNQVGVPNQDTSVLLTSTVQASTGQIVAPIYPFVVTSTFDGWPHLHVGIYDRTHNYDLYDSTLLLEQNPQGTTAQDVLPRSLLDDTPPTFHDDLLFLQSGGGSTDVRTTGTCGSELAVSSSVSSISIEAHIDDVFFPDRTGTDYDSFPGKGTLPDTIGVRAIRTQIVNVGTGEVVYGPSLWTDFSPFAENTCADPNLQTTIACFPPPPTVLNDSLFFKALGNGNGASDTGEDLLYTLWDLGRSSSQYSTVNGEVYWHVVTNAGTESDTFTSTTTTNPWDLTTLPTGLYQVSVEAEDFNQNFASKSDYVVVHKSGDALTPSKSNGLVHPYVSDNDTDKGAVPSTLGGQPFWESPDIFVVVHNAPVTVDGTSTETLVAAGGTYDIYVRVHNDAACDAAHNLVAKIWVADPNALSSAWDSSAVTNGQYLAGDNPVSVLNKGSRGLLGPFRWDVPATYTGDGHKCILADIKSDEENAPISETDAAGSNQVAQRNIQLSNCMYPISNGTGADGKVSIIVSQDNKSLSPTIDGANGGVDFEIAFSDPDGSWFAAWNKNNAAYSVSTANGITLLKLAASKVNLPDATIHSGETRTASMSMGALPSGATATLSLDVTFKSTNGNIKLENGGSCSKSVAPPPPPPPPVK